MITVTRRNQLLHLVHPIALAPLLVLGWAYFTNQLTVNPVQEVVQRSGYFALLLLIASLACTPLNTFLGWKWAISLRRPLGLYAFLYACVHLLAFSWLDYGLNFGLIWRELAEKRYVIVGASAFLLLLPLAITSTRGWQRRLAKRWKPLHRLVYVAALLAALHFVWLVKSDIREPLVYAGVIVALLLVRLPAVRRSLQRLRETASRRRSLTAETLVTQPDERH